MAFVGGGVLWRQSANANLQNPKRVPYRVIGGFLDTTLLFPSGLDRAAWGKL
jgi:hypothetical protein